MSKNVVLITGAGGWLGGIVSRRSLCSPTLYKGAQDVECRCESRPPSSCPPSPLSLGLLLLTFLTLLSRFC